MKVKFTQLISVTAILLVLAGARPTDCRGWSLWNPPASNSKSASKSTRPVSRTAKKPPSAWDKLTSSAKGFFGKIGDTFSPKKSPSKRSAVPQYAYPKYPGLNPRKKNESKSWLGSWFRPKEPEKPKTVSQWMEQNKRLDP